MDPLLFLLIRKHGLSWALNRSMLRAGLGWDVFFEVWQISECRERSSARNKNFACNMCFCLPSVANAVVIGYKINKPFVETCWRKAYEALWMNNFKNNIKMLPNSNYFYHPFVSKNWRRRVGNRSFNGSVYRYCSFFRLRKFFRCCSFFRLSSFFLYLAFIIAASAAATEIFGMVDTATVARSLRL